MYSSIGILLQKGPHLKETIRLYDSPQNQLKIGEHTKNEDD